MILSLKKFENFYQADLIENNKFNKNDNDILYYIEVPNTFIMQQCFKDNGEYGNILISTKVGWGNYDPDNDKLYHCILKKDKIHTLEFYIKYIKDFIKKK